MLKIYKDKEVYILISYRKSSLKSVLFVVTLVMATAASAFASAEASITSTLKEIVCSTVLSSMASPTRAETRTLRAAQSLNALYKFKQYGVPQEALLEVQGKMLSSIQKDQSLLPQEVLEIDGPLFDKIEKVSELPSMDETKLYLNLLVQYNLLCLDESEYFLEKFKTENLPFDGRKILTLINARVGFHHVELAKIVSDEGLHQIPVKLSNGSRVEGSADRGGLQPNYIVDASSPLIQNLYKKVDEITNLSLPTTETISRIGELIRTEAFDHTAYTDAAYLSLLELYRDLGVEIPLSEYLKIRRGTCREVAQLTQLLLDHAGLDSYYYYLKVQTIDARGKKTIEDHAVVLVKLNDEDWIFDNYFRQFNHKKLEALKAGIQTEIGSMYSPVTENGFAKLVEPRKYPRVKTHPRHKRIS